jgi:hypothetical protein
MTYYSNWSVCISRSIILRHRVDELASKLETTFSMVFFGFSMGRAGATILHGVFWILNRQAGGRAGRGDDQ